MKKVFTLLTFLIIATAMVFAGERSEQQMRDAAKDTAGQTRCVHKSKVYVTKRWHVLAIINKNLPFILYKRM